MNLPEDLLRAISVSLDNESLIILRQLDILSFSEAFFQDQYFWFLRISILTKRSLIWSPEEDWREAHRILSQELIKEIPNFFHSEDNPVVPLVLLQEGHIPKDMKNISILGLIRTLKVLLQDGRVDPGMNNNQAIKIAAAYGHEEMVRMLLQDPRVDVGIRVGNWPIKLAAMKGHEGVMKLLLQDPRVDPSAEDNYALKNGHERVVELLLQDPRVRDKR